MRNFLMSLFVFFLYSISCANSVNLSKEKENNNSSDMKDSIEDLSFCTLKEAFKSGERIIIGDWYIVGPYDYFDGVGQDSIKFKSYHNIKDSTFHLIYPPLDSLPEGEFVDCKAYNYVNSENKIYLIDGSYCDYRNVLHKLSNRKIISVSILSPESATMLYGNKYGNNGGIIFTTKPVPRRNYLSFNKKSVCNELIVIDSNEFYQNRVKYKKIFKTSYIKKVKGLIKIPFNNSSLIFKDDLSDENYKEYFLEGEDALKKWILVRQQDYNDNYYYLINNVTNKIDTLADYPLMYDNKLLCVEQGLADQLEFNEIWDVKQNKIKLRKRFSLDRCGLFVIDDIYINKEYLYIKSKTEYFKMKI